MPEQRNTSLVLHASNLSKSYDDGAAEVEVLHKLNFQVSTGERVAIVGASGSGKSTLLNLLGGLDKPDTGEVFVDGKVFSSLSDNARGKVRNQSLGFVYQFHHLLPEFTALENVCMPLLIGGVSKAEAKNKARDLLTKVGLEQRLQHKPAQLSGGERQRVAIARALVNQPQCVLMDEPTGNLDSANAHKIQSLVNDLAREIGVAFVIVTHDEALASTLDKTFVLDKGTLSTSARTPTDESA